MCKSLGMIWFRIWIGINTMPIHNTDGEEKITKRDELLFVSGGARLQEPVWPDQPAGRPSGGDWRNQGSGAPTRPHPA